MERRTIPSSPEEFAGLLHELRLGHRQRKQSLRAQQHDRDARPRGRVQRTVTLRETKSRHTVKRDG
jgi:hypothetical protein